MNAQAATPRELLARGLTREQARFAAWVLALLAQAPAVPLSAARLAEDWGTDRSWVCRALPAIAAAGVWSIERVGRLVRIATASASSLSLGQRNSESARCSSGNERAAVRGLGDNEQPLRCLSGNELLLQGQREDLNSSSNNERTPSVPLQRQRTHQPTAGARPVAAAARAVVSDEKRNGGCLGRRAATEPAEQITSKDAQSLHVIEDLLGRVGLVGRVAARLASTLNEQASAAKRDAVELARGGVDAASSAKNPAGWLRRAIEGAWLLERTLPGATASHSKPAGAPNQPARAPLKALPRVSPTLWDIELEGAVIHAISGEPRWVARARTWMGVHGGVDRCFAQMREQVRRAPEDLEGIVLDGGVRRWQSVLPQLEQYAAKARAKAIAAGEIVA